MPKVTLYSKPRDEETWEWAREHAGHTSVSLSHLVWKALTEYRTRIEAAAAKAAAER